jgi:repressor LexA
MHNIQESILKIVDTHNLGGMTLREIGELVNEKFPQKIKHHLTQLEKKGLIKIDKKNNSITRAKTGKIKGTNLISIPILGTANCGPATFFAEENFTGHLKLSESFLKKKSGLYAVVADGISMNRANVGNQTIDSGDYLIVDSTKTDPSDGDVIVSVFDGVANVKRFKRDQQNARIVLQSESTANLAPILIHEDDDFHVAGKVIQVIKKA